MKIYLLYYWMEHEGDNLISAHKTKEGALEAADKYVKNSYFKGWHRNEGSAYTVWGRNGGGEGLSIYEHELYE